MTQRQAWGRLGVALSLGCNLFVLAVMAAFAFATYPALVDVPRDDLPRVYAQFQALIVGDVVPFEFAAFLVTPLLYLAWPARRVHAVIALGVAYFAVTFAWHLPALRHFVVDGAGAGPILASQYARLAVQVGRAALLVALAAKEPRDGA